MKRGLLALALLLALAPTRAHATGPALPIPTSDYPPNVQVTAGPVSNAVWSCTWAVDCTGDTGVVDGSGDHTGDAAHFHRIDGWVERGEGFYQAGGAFWMFALQASRFAPGTVTTPSGRTVSNAEAAALDWLFANPLPGQHPCRYNLARTLGAPGVTAFCLRIDDPRSDDHMLLVALVSGDDDIEAYGLAHGLTDWKTQLRPDLMAQLRAALTTLPSGGSHAR